MGMHQYGAAVDGNSTGFSKMTNFVRARSALFGTLILLSLAFLRTVYLTVLQKLIPQTDSSPLPEDVFISVKTTQKFHASRLQVILDTWFEQARRQTYFFTDSEDTDLRRRLGDHLVVTNCTASHSRQALCCKMGAEYDHFMKTDKSWFCHFDDDNYVHVPNLAKLLQQYDPQKDWYIGRPSTRTPISIMDREHMPDQITFWFATGGAGVCLSRSLAVKMQELMGDGKFAQIGERIRLPDDVTLGYIVEHLLGKKLTVVKSLHSHLESMRAIKSEMLGEQVTLSGGSYNEKTLNVVDVPELFLPVEDPNRLKSLHCFFYPDLDMCRRKPRR